MIRIVRDVPTVFRWRGEATRAGFVGLVVLWLILFAVAAVFSSTVVGWLVLVALCLVVLVAGVAAVGRSWRAHF